MTLIDTAPAYGPFHNEELVGRAINGRRAETVLATKVGLLVDTTTYEFRKDGRPESVKASCEDSLRRLKVDHIDLFQLHRVDPEVPLEETWGAMGELVSRGLVGHLGLSEVTVEECARAAAVHPVASVQSEFSLWTRDRLDDVIPWCESNGASFIPFAPLGRGYLTGALDAGTEFDAKDFRSRNPQVHPGGPGGEPGDRRRDPCRGRGSGRDSRAGGDRVDPHGLAHDRADPRHPAPGPRPRERGRRHAGALRHRSQTSGRAAGTGGCPLLTRGGG